jgi:sugar phosphate isomerase/epimerase
MTRAIVQRLGKEETSRVDDLSRVAINQATTRLQWDFRQSVEGYARHGVRRTAVWRDKMAACGLAEARRLLDDHGFTVTGLNRAGPLTAPDTAGRRAALDDACRAIEEAAAIRAACLLVLTGTLPAGSRDLSGTRAQIADALAELAPHARAAGVRLGLEPLHPMVAADRSCLNTLAEANDLCDALGPAVGLVVDVYHVWWDPELEREIRRAGSARLVGFHVSDWLVPTRDLVFDRGMMGDGVIDIPGLRRIVEAAGYDGAVEVEIFSDRDWWRRDPDEVVRVSLERCRTAV